MWHKPIMRASKLSVSGVIVVAGLVGLLGLCVLTAQAQDPKVTVAGQVENQTITVTIHHSVVLHTPWPAKRVAVTDPAVADYKLLNPDSVMVMGKVIGSTDVMVWNEKEELFQAHIEVVADLEHLKKELARLFPQSPLQITQSQGVIVISGSLTRAEHADQIHKFMDATVSVTRVEQDRDVWEIGVRKS